MKHHQVFVLKMSSTDVRHQLGFYPLMFRPNESRGSMWLVSVLRSLLVDEMHVAKAFLLWLSSSWFG